MARAKIDPSEKITLKLRARDKDLLSRKVFLVSKNDYISRLGRDTDSSHLEGLYTLDELKLVLEHLAMAVSTEKELKGQRELESLYGYVSRIIAHHDSSHC